MKPVRIAIFGAGDNTRAKHIPNFKAIEGVSIDGVCNRTRESSQRVASQFGIKKTYADFVELVSDPDIDAVMIGTWPYMHAQVSIAALCSGKHVMCEARMAASAAEARAMLEAKRKQPKCTAQIVPSPFTLRVDTTVQKMIAAGAIGQVLAVDLRAAGSFINREAPLTWRQNVDYSGVNIMSLGIWYEALMRWVGGATCVSARGKVFQKTRKDERGIMTPVRVPEHVDVSAELACGAQLHMLISSVAGLAGPTEAFVFGDEGTLRFSDENLFHARKGDKELKEVAIPAADQGRWRVEEEFINAIRGVEPITRTTFEDGVKYMAFTEAVARSCQTGERYALPFAFNS